MIRKEKIQELIADLLAENSDIFVVSLEISSSNRISLFIDSMKGIRVDDCVKFSRAIESGLDREEADFELEVSSPGADAPFMVREQYLKNLGRNVEIMLRDGSGFKAKLLEAGQDLITVDAEVIQKIENSKKKKISIEKKSLAYHEIQKIKVLLKF